MESKDLLAMSPSSVQTEAPLELGRRLKRVEDWLVTLNSMVDKDSPVLALLDLFKRHMSLLDSLYMMLLTSYEVADTNLSSPTDSSTSTTSGLEAGSALWDLPTIPSWRGILPSPNSPESPSKRRTE